MDKTTFAAAKYLDVSPRKMRLYTKGLRGLSAQKALSRLSFTIGRPPLFLIKLIKQGIANAVNNQKLEASTLYIDRLEVGDGPRAKRMDRSHGARFDRGVIQKRQSHLKLTLISKELPAAAPVEKQPKALKNNK